MRQLRLQVFLPVALLGLAGIGFSVLTSRPASEAAPLPVPARHEAPASRPEPATKPNKPAKQHEPAKPAAEQRTALERALAAHKIVVLAFYAPQGSVDDAVIREARAGALDAGAGFLAVNVTRNGDVSQPATQYDVFEAPAVLVFRSSKVVARFDSYADRETIAQAVVNAL
jgi:hypothetical protein